MSSHASTRQHVVMDIAALAALPKERSTVINGIVTTGATSPLAVTHQSLATAVTALGDAFKAEKVADTLADGTAALAAIDAGLALTAHGVTDGALILVRDLTENYAKKPSDIESMAMIAWKGKPAVLDVVPPPDSIDLTYGKKGTGKVTASAHETGGVRGRYAVESSVEPFGAVPGTTVAGPGKSRKLTGKPGTSEWIRFARLYKHKQSAWSTPVLVTFP